MDNEGLFLTVIIILKKQALAFRWSTHINFINVKWIRKWNNEFRWHEYMNIMCIYNVCQLAFLRYNTYVYIYFYIIFIVLCLFVKMSLNFPGSFNWLTICAVYNLLIYMYVCENTSGFHLLHFILLFLFSCHKQLNGNFKGITFVMLAAQEQIAMMSSC